MSTGEAMRDADRRPFGRAMGQLGFVVKVFAVSLSAGVLSWIVAWMAVEQGVDSLRQAMPSMIEETLRQNTGIVREALVASRAEDERREAEQRRAMVREAIAEIIRDPDNPVRGNPRGDVTIVEFFDVRCPFCRRLHTEMEALLRQDGMIRVVMRDLPILGPQSLFASHALLAARNQGAYERLYHRLMTIQGDINDGTLRPLVEEMGLDWERLRADMEAPAVRAWIEGNLALARRLSINGTPALLIGDELVLGAIDREALRRLVESTRRRN